MHDLHNAKLQICNGIQKILRVESGQVTIQAGSPGARGTRKAGTDGTERQTRHGTPEQQKGRRLPT